jgi:hypothetical protein
LLILSNGEPVHGPQRLKIGTDSVDLEQNLRLMWAAVSQDRHDTC